MKNEVLDISSEGSEGTVISIKLNIDELTREQKKLAWENTCKVAEMPEDKNENEYH